MPIFLKAPPRRKPSARTMVHAGGPAPGLARIHVGRRAGEASAGKLVIGGLVIPCALGRGGVTHRKREGDGATPAGELKLVGLLQRLDRTPPLRCGLPRRLVRSGDGWCDDPASALYNRPLRLPARVSHEELWRRDALYDLVVTLEFNLQHPRKGRGSAIFFHVADPRFTPTAGCVAISQAALRRLLPRVSIRTRLVVRG